MVCGSSDIPLSEEGRREAELLRQTAAGLKFDLVISSPMLRARETAEAVVGGRDIPILFDNRLSERMFGAFEGTS